jgi:hypothetical protein
MEKGGGFALVGGEQRLKVDHARSVGKGAEERKRSPAAGRSVIPDIASELGGDRPE